MNQEKKGDNFMRNMFVSLIVIVILLLGVNSWTQNSNQVPTGDVPAVTDESVRSDDNYIGQKNAKVVLIEYADLQCPACKAYESILTKIAAEHNNDSFAYVYRYFPLINIHSHALLAASYNEAAARQGKFWEMNRALYNKQDEWSEALDAETKILSYAKELGLDIKKLTNDAKSQEISDKVNNSLKEATRMGLDSTPTLILNGVKIKVNGEEELRGLINAAILKARNSSASTTSANK